MNTTLPITSSENIYLWNKLHLREFSYKDGVLDLNGIYDYQGMNFLAVYESLPAPEIITQSYSIQDFFIQNRFPIELVNPQIFKRELDLLAKNFQAEQMVVLDIDDHFNYSVYVYSLGKSSSWHEYEEENNSGSINATPNLEIHKIIDIKGIVNFLKELVLEPDLITHWVITGEASYLGRSSRFKDLQELFLELEDKSILPKINKVIFDEYLIIPYLKIFPEGIQSLILAQSLNEIPIIILSWRLWIDEGMSITQEGVAKELYPVGSGSNLYKLSGDIVIKEYGLNLHNHWFWFSRRLTEKEYRKVDHIFISKQKQNCYKSIQDFGILEIRFNKKQYDRYKKDKFNQSNSTEIGKYKIRSSWDLFVRSKLKKDDFLVVDGQYVELGQELTKDKVLMWDNQRQKLVSPVSGIIKLENLSKGIIEVISKNLYNLPVSDFFANNSNLVRKLSNNKIRFRLRLDKISVYAVNGLNNSLGQLVFVDESDIKEVSIDLSDKIFENSSKNHNPFIVVAFEVKPSYRQFQYLINSGIRKFIFPGKPDFFDKIPVELIRNTVIVEYGNAYMDRLPKAISEMFSKKDRDILYIDKSTLELKWPNKSVENIFASTSKELNNDGGMFLKGQIVKIVNVDDYGEVGKILSIDKDESRVIVKYDNEQGALVDLSFSEVSLLYR